MSRFRHMIFVCETERAPDNPKGCCQTKGSAGLVDRLKELSAEHGLKGKVRITTSGCLNFCKKGVAAVAFSADPERAETWYTGLGPGDADALFEAHVLNEGRLKRAVEPIKRPQIVHERPGASPA